MKWVVNLYKNAYGGLSHSTWWLSLIMLINRSGTMVLPFMTLYLTHERSVSIADAGIVMAFFGAGAIFGGLFGGWLTDRIGFYSVQYLSLISGGIMFIILGQMHNLLLICICTFLLSAMNDCFRPANSAAIAHYSLEKNRARSYALNRLAINLGWAVGNVIGGIIAHRNYELLFWVDGLTNIGAALLLRFVLSPSRNRQTKEAAVKKPAPGGLRFAAYRDGTYMFFAVMTMLFAYCFFQSFTTLPVFFRDNMHLNETEIGLVNAVNGVLIALVEMILVFKLEGRRHMMQFIAAGVLLSGIAFIMYNLFPGALVLAVCSMLILTLGEMLSMPFMNTFWIKRSTDANRGQYAGVYTVSWAAAQVLGPLTGAWIAHHAGFDVLWWAVGGICILTAAGFNSIDPGPARDIFRKLLFYKAAGRTKSNK